MTAKIALIGAGNMGHSLMSGLLQQGYPAANICVSDPSPDKLASLQEFKVATTTDNKIALQNADIVIFAIKPQIFAQVAQPLKEIINCKRRVILSVAAGITEKSIAKWLGEEIAIVRAMPNTPALIGCGATALHANTHVTQAEREQAEQILQAVGIVVWVNDEAQLDVVTALSASGPAYFFLVMEALEQAAHEMGLAKNIAHQLTVQTAYGAAELARQSQKPLAVLRQEVTSPGGTTEKGLSVLFEHQIEAIFKKVLQSAKSRAEELAKSFGS